MMPIMYTCETCADHVPESCGHFDRSDLRVMPDGTWICRNCFDDWDDRDGEWDDFPAPALSTPSPAIDKVVEALDKVYERYGPHEDFEGPVDPAIYARMSTNEIDDKWDFEDRHLMLVVAKALSALRKPADATP